MATRAGRFPIEVRPVVAPDGGSMVLLQLPDCHILVSPQDALRVASMLVASAGEVAYGWDTSTWVLPVEDPGP